MTDSDKNDSGREYREIMQEIMWELKIKSELALKKLREEAKKVKFKT